jgi:putative transposase
MVRPIPLQFGAHYHVFNRGNNRENLFFEERNYRHFLRLYAKYVLPVVDTYAYCLLPNHFHLLIRVKLEEEQQTQTFGVSLGQPDVSTRVPGTGNKAARAASKTPKVLSPSRQFAHCFNAYSKAVNKAYNRTGSLFERPFQRIAVTSDAYFMQLVVYIHRNPQKHGLVDDFRDWPYTSYHSLLSTKPTHLRRQDVLGWFDGQAGLEARHREEMQEAKIGALLLDDL